MATRRVRVILVGDQLHVVPRPAYETLLNLSTEVLDPIPVGHDEVYVQDMFVSEVDFARYVEEALSTKEAVSKDLGRTFREIASVTEYLAASMDTSNVDLVFVSDTTHTELQFLRDLDDFVGTSDDRWFITTKGLASSAPALDRVAKWVGTTAADSSVVADGITLVAEFVRTMGDLVLTQDAVAFSYGYNRELSDVATPIDRVTKDVGPTLVDKAYALSTKLSKNISTAPSDIFSMKDSTILEWGWGRTIRNTAAALDRLAKVLETVRRDSFGVSDEIDTVKSTIREVLDSVLLVDELSKSVGTIAASSFGVVDGVEPIATKDTTPGMFNEFAYNELTYGSAVP